MAASKAEQVLEAMKMLLETVPGAVVERNSVLPEKVPDGGLTYGRPEPGIEAVAGAPAIKTATLSVTVDYETDAPLA